MEGKLCVYVLWKRTSTRNIPIVRKLSLYKHPPPLRKNGVGTYPNNNLSPVHACLICSHIIKGFGEICLVYIFFNAFLCVLFVKMLLLTPNRLPTQNYKQACSYFFFSMDILDYLEFRIK